jgi:hypothetical protein
MASLFNENRWYSELVELKRSLFLSGFIADMRQSNDDNVYKVDAERFMTHLSHATRLAYGYEIFEFRQESDRRCKARRALREVSPFVRSGG